MPGPETAKSVAGLAGNQQMEQVSASRLRGKCGCIQLTGVAARSLGRYPGVININPPLHSIAPDADALPLVREVRSSLKVERLHLSLRGAEEPLQAARGRDAPSCVVQRVPDARPAALDVARRPPAPDLGGANRPLARRPRRRRAMHGKFGAS